jgi:hypothetical protein
MEKLFGNLTHKILVKIRTSKIHKQKQTKMKLSEFFRKSPLASVDFSRDKTGIRNKKTVE